MLTIRLTRKGKKNQPFFDIVVTDKRRSSTGGRAVDILGYVNPLTKKHSIKADRAKYWISKGAQPSDTIHNLFVSDKIIEGKKVHVSRIKKQENAASPAAAAAPAEAKKEEPKPEPEQPAA